MLGTKKLLTEEECAIYLSVSKAFLRAARCTGTIPGRREAPPFVRLGRMIRYRRADLDAWIEAHVVNGGVGQ